MCILHPVGRCFRQVTILKPISRLDRYVCDNLKEVRRAKKVVF